MSAIAALCRTWMLAGRQIVLATQLDQGLERAIAESPYTDRVFQLEDAEGLSEQLEQLAIHHGWDNFGICGLGYDTCIKATAKFISEKGLGCVVTLDDLCCDEECDHQETMSAVMELRNGSVMPSTE